MPLEYWDHSFLTTTYLINLLPSSSLNFETPYFTLFKRVPDYKAVRVFGCACFSCLRPYNQSKLQPRSEECLFLGYSENHKGYNCLSKQGKIYISKDVIFNETHFPFLSLFSPKSPNTSSNCIPVPFTNTQSFILPPSNPPIPTASSLSTKNFSLPSSSQNP